MNPKSNNPEVGKKKSPDYYDMTEEASKRPQPNASTEQARQLESDDANEEIMQGQVSSPSGDNWGESKVATSLDDES